MQQNSYEPVDFLEGKYVIVNKIASGAFGNVFLGFDVSNGEEVAIKVESALVCFLHIFYINININ